MSGFVDATAGAVEHCEAMSQQHEDLAADYYQPIKSFLETKRWHQLTLKIMEFVSDPKTVRRTASDDVHSYLALYDKVVLPVDRHLHALSLARIAAAVSQSLAVQDTTAAKAVLENLLAKKEEASSYSFATLYVQSKLSLLQLQTLPPEGSQTRTETLASILTMIRKNASTLNELLVPDLKDQAILNAAHYEQAMMYYKVVGPPEAYYDQAISFLKYAPPTGGKPEVASQVDYHQLGVDLCLAALTGDGVYNLGQVLESAPQQLLADLQKSPDGWLIDMLRACADGDIDGFQKLTAAHKAAIDQQPALVHRATAVQEKLTLLALVQTVFRKPAHERTLTFDELAQNLQVPADQVEWIAMRALSVGLVQGSMDQVDQTLQVSWVLPRILSPDEMTSLAGRYGEWAVKVSKLQESVQKQTPTFA